MQRRAFDIWCEGYSATGEHAPAWLLGAAVAETFADACRKWAQQCEAPHLFDPEALTYCGCRLFDNEADARRSFG